MVPNLIKYLQLKSKIKTEIFGILILIGGRKRGNRGSPKLYLEVGERNLSRERRWKGARQRVGGVFTFF